MSAPRCSYCSTPMVYRVLCGIDRRGMAYGGGWRLCGLCFNKHILKIIAEANEDHTVEVHAVIFGEHGRMEEKFIASIRKRKPACSWCGTDDRAVLADGSSLFTCDCLLRINCPTPGKIGHLSCGVCEHGNPRFICSARASLPSHRFCFSPPMKD